MAFEDNLDRGLEADSMAGRDEDRFDPIPGPKNRSNRFSLISQGRPTSSFWARFLVFAAKTGFGAADRRAIEQKSHMACNAKPPRMGDPLTVKEDEIGKIF